MAFDTASTIPALDQILCNVWPEISVDTYAKYDYVLTKAEATRRKMWPTFGPLIKDTVPWNRQPSTTMRAVLVEDAPIMRQSFRPKYLTSQPLESIFMVRERTAEARLYMQDYSSIAFSFLPSFQDFMQGNVVPTRKTIEKQVMVDEELFYRTYMWDYSPNVYVCGQGRKSAPVGRATETTSAKTDAWIAAQLSLTGGVKPLTIEEVFNAGSVFMEEIGAEPYSGDGMPNGDNQILDQKFVLVTSNEAWLQFTNDPWVKENRPDGMNILNSAFKGPIHDTIVGRIEKWPMRWSVDANNDITENAPEIVDLNSSSPDYGRPQPNPSYTKLDDDGSPYEVAWLFGGRHYKRIETGPPPELFAGSVADPAKLKGMTWNGQIYLNRPLLVPCVDVNNTMQYKENNRGRYIQWLGSQALGCLGIYTWNVMPIIHRRRRGIATTGVV